MFLSLVLAALLADPAPPPIRGTLCVSERKASPANATCSDVEGTTPAVEAADHERLYRWMSADAKTVQLGVVAAKATTIELEKPDRREVKFSISGEASRGWPLDTTVLVAGKEQWTWSMPAKAVPRLERFFVPAGTYGIQLDAEHHRTFRIRPIRAGEKPLNAGELRLTPLPIARGQVVDLEGKPIAGALIAFEDAAPCSYANEQGAFTCEIPEKKRVEVLVVSDPGFATREVALPPKRLESEIDLGRVVLSAGRPLIVRIIRPDAKKPVSVTLFYSASNRYEHSKLATKEVTEREQELTFEGIAKGKYLVVVEGSEPLEKLEVPLEVKDDGDAEKTIRIEPFQLEGTIRFGEETLAEATLELIAPDHSWRQRMEVRGGTFGGSMWQHGVVTAFVRSPSFGTSQMVSSPSLGDDPSRWDVTIPRREIIGRVLDADTRKPARGATMDIVSQYANGRSYLRGKVESDGTYRVLAAEPGQYMLKVTSPDHVSSTTEVSIAEEDAVKTVDIVLEAGVLQPLAIVTTSGEPIANAVILEGVHDDRVNPRFISNVDSAGRYALRGKAGETRVLYVVPRDSSFAVVRLLIPRSNDQAKPVQVIVPPATASLRVRTEDGDGKLMPARLLIRYNGEFVPGAIARFVTGDFPGTGPSGEAVLSRFPAGAYEVWALAGDRDEVALIASGGTLRPPARVGLAAGEQKIVLTAPERETRMPVR